jgi:hypothetical protein
MMALFLTFKPLEEDHYLPEWEVPLLELVARVDDRVAS